MSYINLKKENENDEFWVCGQVKVETKVVSGDAREVICQMVDKLDADVLVMGSHGYGPIKRLVISSGPFRFMFLHVTCVFICSCYVNFVNIFKIEVKFLKCD